MSENKALTPERLREEAKKLYDNGNAPARGRRVEVTAIQTLQDAAVALGRRDAVIKQLVEACQRTINENLNLADGEVCALIHIKRALAAAKALERE